MQRAGHDIPVKSACGIEKKKTIDNRQPTANKQEIKQNKTTIKYVKGKSELIRRKRPQQQLQQQQQQQQQSQ